MKIKLLYLSLLLLTSQVQSQCWQSVDNENDHAVAIHDDGTLWTWGRNIDGALGDGTTVNKFAPTFINTGSNTWAKVSTGYNHTLAITTQGYLWSWGDNLSGQLGNSTTTNSLWPIQIGTDNQWRNIAGGMYHSLAIKNDGTLWSWGQNQFGQLGDPSVTTMRSFPVQIGTENNWLLVFADINNSFAIKTDGSLWGWGRNNWGNIGDGTINNQTQPVRIGNDNDWIYVKSGIQHTIALKTDGTMWAWGTNNLGLFGNGTNISSFTPIQIGTDSDWSVISVGYNFAGGIKTDGKLYMWGNNDYGQLGIGSSQSINIPVQIGTATDWSTLSLGSGSSMSIKSDSRLFSWGFNGNGTLGINNSSYTMTVPTSIICMPLANLEYSKPDYYRISPNPASDFISLQGLDMKFITEILIYDSTGKTVVNLRENFSSINIQSLNPGIFIMRVLYCNENYNFKFIKK